MGVFNKSFYFMEKYAGFDLTQYMANLIETYNALLGEDKKSKEDPLGRSNMDSNYE
jgi:hypothetical protein